MLSKILGPKKVFVKKKKLGLKEIWVQKILGLKILWVKKNFGEGCCCDRGKPKSTPAWRLKT